MRLKLVDPQEQLSNPAGSVPPSQRLSAMWSCIYEGGETKQVGIFR